MNRLCKFGLIASAVLLLVAAALPQRGRVVADEALKELRGGRVCSMPITKDAGCQKCNFIRNCMGTDQYGHPFQYQTYSICSNGNFNVLCYDNQFGPPTQPQCDDSAQRNATCGTGTLYSPTFSDCSNSTSSSYFCCGKLHRLYVHGHLQCLDKRHTNNRRQLLWHHPRLVLNERRRVVMSAHARNGFVAGDGLAKSLRAASIVSLRRVRRPANFCGGVGDRVACEWRGVNAL